jgi:hypothetical protein
MKDGEDMKGSQAKAVIAVAALPACQRKGSSFGIIRVNACERELNVPPFRFKCFFWASGNMINENL